MSGPPVVWFCLTILLSMFHTAVDMFDIGATHDRLMLATSFYILLSRVDLIFYPIIHQLMFTSSFLIKRSGFSRSNPTSQIAPTISSHGHTASSPHPSLPSFTPLNRAPRSKSLLPICFLTHNLALPLSRSTVVVSTRHWGHRLASSNLLTIETLLHRNRRPLHNTASQVGFDPSRAATGALSTVPPSVCWSLARCHRIPPHRVASQVVIDSCRPLSVAPPLGLLAIASHRTRRLTR